MYLCNLTIDPIFSSMSNSQPTSDTPKKKNEYQTK